MNSTADDIKDMLQGESDLALEFGVNLFVGREPTAPKNCVTVFDTPGGAPQLSFDRNEEYRYESIQIRVRNTSYTAAFDLINRIMTSLHGRANESWNDTLYTVIYCSSGPALLDWDDENNVRLIINFESQRRKGGK